MNDKWIGLLLGAAIGYFACYSIAHASEHMRFEPCGGARDYHECAVITISGQIFPADLAEFIARIKDIRHARVDLAGPGGALRPAINIGEHIHARHWDTAVLPDSQCLSACAYIWLAGSARTMGPKSVLMWHSAFLGEDDQHADGNGNALIGMYLAHMGLGYDAVDWMVGNDPNDEKAAFMDANGVPTEKQFRFIRGTQ